MHKLRNFISNGYENILYQYLISGVKFSEALLRKKNCIQVIPHQLCCRVVY